jgi:hypothetical protein
MVSKELFGERFTGSFISNDNLPKLFCAMNWSAPRAGFSRHQAAPRNVKSKPENLTPHLARSSGLNA